MKRYITQPVTLALIPVTLAAGVAGAAWAGTDKTAEMSDTAEVQAVLASPMSLGQAIDTAQTMTGGTALSAAWENNDAGQWGYEVEIADAAKVVGTWFVNPKDGSVTQVAETQDDGDEGETDAD